jgi:hypothetical protein
VNKAGDIVIARKYVLAILCIYCVTSGLIKISILLFYRRLSSRVVSKTFRWVTWGTIGMIVAYTIALTIAPIVGCQPFSAYWDQVDVIKRLQGYKYHCFDEGADLVAATIISAVQDLVTAVLPTLLYWNLRIPIRQKIALFGIFSLGYGVVALGAMRAYYAYRTYYLTYDTTWSTWDLLLTTILELHVGAFCANAPTLKVFFKHFFHDKLTQHSNSKTPKNSNNSSGHSGSTASRGMLGKLASMLSSSHGKSGYISETHNTVSVDVHGGVQVQKEVQITHSPLTPRAKGGHTSTDLLYDQYYKDIELGSYSPGKDSAMPRAQSKHFSEVMGLSALPQMPTSPTAANTIIPLATFESIKSHVRRPSTGQQPAATPVHALQAERENEREVQRAPTPLPPPVGSLGEKRPEWQSWA